MRERAAHFALALALQVILGHSHTVAASSKGSQSDNDYEFSPDYFGVSFSPYGKTHELNDKQESVFADWNSYTLENVKVMLKVVSKRVKNIATYTSGTYDGNLNSSWDKGQGNAFVARAAAQINKEAGEKVLSMAQGIYQSPSYSWTDESSLFGQKEIEYAFQEAEDANSLFPGTVWGIIIYNQHVFNEDQGKETLDTIRRLKQRAHNVTLKIGTRIGNCDQINGGDLKEFIEKIALESDFLMCNIHPKDNDGSKSPAEAVKDVGERFWKFATPLKKLNPRLEVMIGDSGWPSQGVSYSGTHNTLANMRDYWHGLNEWATANKIRVQLFEAFDEPWKMNTRSTDWKDPSGIFGSEAHFGWWKLLDNNNITEATILEKVSEIAEPQTTTTQSIVLDPLVALDGSGAERRSDKVGSCHD